ncbi:MAG: hypothetical protein MZV63_26115 [Marinilabiliales bacterium]|nr:hypothetical protein [Marinilabiliales bacterium]
MRSILKILAAVFFPKLPDDLRDLLKVGKRNRPLQACPEAIAAAGDAFIRTFDPDGGFVLIPQSIDTVGTKLRGRPGLTRCIGSRRHAETGDFSRRDRFRRHAPSPWQAPIPRHPRSTWDFRFPPADFKLRRRPSGNEAVHEGSDEDEGGKGNQNPGQGKGPAEKSHFKGQEGDFQGGKRAQVDKHVPG